MVGPISHSFRHPCRENRNLTSLLFNFAFVLKQESQTNWPNRPESYTNDVKVNPTQKGTEKFIMLTRKICPCRTLREYSKLL